MRARVEKRSVLGWNKSFGITLFYQQRREKCDFLITAANNMFWYPLIDWIARSHWPIFSMVPGGGLLCLWSCDVLPSVYTPPSETLIKSKPMFWYWSRSLNFLVAFQKRSIWEEVLLWNCIRINIHEIIHVNLKPAVIMTPFY